MLLDKKNFWIGFAKKAFISELGWPHLFHNNVLENTPKRYSTEKPKGINLIESRANLRIKQIIMVSKQAKNINKFEAKKKVMK